MRAIYTFFTYSLLLVIFSSAVSGSSVPTFSTTSYKNTTFATSSVPKTLLTSTFPSAPTTTTVWFSSANGTITSASTLTASISTSPQHIQLPNSTHTSHNSSIKASYTSHISLTTRISASIITASPSINATFSSATAAATVTLAPAVHWDHDLSDLDHIAPQATARLFYAEQPGLGDPSVGGQFAHVTTNFTYPSVILEHSGLIDNVACRTLSSDASRVELNISFSNIEAYQSAKWNWTQHADLVLITYIPGCGLSASDQRAFWKADVVRFDDIIQNVFATAHEIPLQESVSHMDLEWGNYEPPSNMSSYTTVSDSNATASAVSSAIAACGTSFPSTVDGFPTAPCGPNFDQTLDDSIGYVRGRIPSSLSRRTLGKRCHWYQVACLAKEAWEAAQRLIHKVDPHWDPSVSKQVSFSLGAPSSSLVSTPFGRALKLYRYQKDAKDFVAAYCVDCGVSGTVTLFGSASLGLLEGIRSAQVGMNGKLHASIYLGIDAEGNFSPVNQKQALWSVGIPGLSVPGIYSIGPMISVGTEISVGVQASGQVLFGAALDWSAFSVTMDLLHARNSQSHGLTPQVTTKFLAAGHITATAGISLPISVGIGLDIPVLNFHKALELVEKPGLSSSLSFSAGSSSVSTLTSSCNNGISGSTYFTNDVYVSVFDLTRWNIWSYKSAPFLRFCKLFHLRHTTGDEHKRSEVSENLIDRRDSDSSNETSLLSPEGTTYTSVVDMNLVYQLSAAKDGNFYLDSNGSPNVTYFDLSQNASLNDRSGRNFHFYSDTMAKYGVSRFRLNDPTVIPKTAQIAALALFGDIGGKFPSSIFGVLDPSGAVSYPVVCQILGQVAKIFLVKDIDAGLQTLLREDLRHTITGGQVQKCDFIPLTTGMSVPASR